MSEAPVSISLQSILTPCYLIVKYLAVGCYYYSLKWYCFTACFNGFLSGCVNSSAAGYAHTHNGDALYIVEREYRRQLFGIINAVKLGTADKRDFILYKIVVEISVGERRAVGGNEQVCRVEVRRIDRNKLYLNRPLREPAFGSDIVLAVD